MEQSIQWCMQVPFCSENPFKARNSSLRRFKKARISRLECFEDFFPGQDDKGKLKEIHFFTTQFNSPTLTTMFEVLKDLPNLEKINLGFHSELQRRFAIVDMSTIPEFSKLKTLELAQCYTSFLPFFRKAQIRTLIITREGCSNSRTALLEFFKSQPCLKTLQLNSSATTYKLPLFQSPLEIEMVPFKLEKLSLVDFKLEDASDYNNVLKFMELHAESLETLELGLGFPELIYEFVIAKLKTLKTLRLIVNDLPRDPEFYKRLEMNGSITSLSLRESFFAESKPSSEIISHLPSIKNLVVVSMIPFTNSVLTSGTLKSLKKLTIQAFGPGDFDRVNFPELESLEFFCAGNQNQISELRRLLKNEKLRELVYDGSVDKNMFQNEFKRLESIDLKKSLVKARLPETKGIRGLRLREDDFFKSLSPWKQV